MRTAHQRRVLVMRGVPLIRRGGLQLFLHHLGTIVLGRIAHHLVLVDWGLTISIRVRGAVCRALSTAFDKNMSLFIQSVSVFFYAKGLQLLDWNGIKNEPSMHLSGRSSSRSVRKGMASQPDGSAYVASDRGYG